MVIETPDSYNTALLRFTQWTIGFSSGNGDEKIAVEQLEFELGKGESLGVVGESGSGKTLTALSVMQLLPGSANARGEIWWKRNTRLDQLSEPALNNIRGKEIGMIFQEPLSSLNPVMSCGEQIDEVLRKHLGFDKNSARQKTLEWLGKVELREPQRIYKAYPHELSGGQRQRVMIAMALCAEPELLIADEPTTALDVTVQRAILDLIKRLQAELGIAILFISHDLGVIREIADRVMVMQNGHKVEDAKVAQIFSNAHHPYTKGLLNCRATTSEQLRRLPTVQDFLSKNQQELSVFMDDLKLSEKEMIDRRDHLSSQEAIVEVTDLSVWYSAQRNWLGQTTEYVKAVDQVSFSLRRGECLGIVGESGSGKTTLGKAILSLLTIRSGVVMFENHQLTSLSEQELRPLRPDLQMVFQDPFSSLNPKLTILQLLEEPLLIHDPNKTPAIRNNRILEVLEQVGLDETVLSRYPKAFSGGQRQRIGLARALLLRPKVLVCDESVSALDVSVQAQVLNLIKDLQDTYQFSLLFISHDLAVIRFIADRVLVMQKGKMVEIGTTDELFSAPKETYTRKLLDAVLD